MRNNVKEFLYIKGTNHTALAIEALVSVIV
jgi:hypothetical protein